MKKNSIDHSYKSIHFGRIYILAPEGACNNNASVANLGLFEEVWQYGSDYARTDLQPSQPVYLQDGIAPQSEVYTINNKSKNPKGGRAFIPSTEPKGFITSHLGGNYKWIFEKQFKGMLGYVARLSEAVTRISSQNRI
jgi:hypothetical protein